VVKNLKISRASIIRVSPLPGFKTLFLLRKAVSFFQDSKKIEALFLTLSWII